LKEAAALMKFDSIAKRIFTLVIPTIIITTLSFVVLSYYVSNSRINKTINEKMHESLNVADLEIQLELYKNASVAINLARYGKALSLDVFDHEKHKNILMENIVFNENTFGGGVWFEPYAFDSSSYYFGPFLYDDGDGDVIYIPNYGDTVDYFNEDWYIKGRSANGELVWSKVYYDPVSAITMVTASKAFFDNEGKFIGMGTADMNIENIREIVNGISVDETGKAFIIGSTGEYISFYDEEKSVNNTMQADNDEALAQLGKELMENTSGTTTLIRDGKKLRVYYMTMDNVNWKLAVTVEESEINSSTLSSFIIMTIIPVLGLLIVILGIFMITKYLRKIVSKVNNFADMAASGDLSKRIEVTETDEFGFMEQRLNIMISNMNDMNNHSAELLEIAEKASNSKSEFLSRMSHEIRTPMNAIIGMTQIARTSNDPDRINDCLVKIDNASKHLLTLLNDILDMSKIEANKLELSKEEFSLEQALTNIYNMMLVKAEEKNQQLTLNIDKNVPSRVIGDELRFSQVVTNLVGNAVKFTPENGSISVEVGTEENDDEYSIIKVCVKDTGIGLSQEQQARLFQSFEQGDGSISRRFGGTGLGLAISKRIVEMMGGRIMVASEPGKGSVFTFTIKVLRCENSIKSQPEQLSKDEMEGLRILVADDSVEANEYMKHVLNSLTLDCDNACDGYEALESAKNAIAQNHPYDIIFMDYMMPRLNGIEAAKAIQALSNESTAIIMVSIYEWKDIEQEAQDAGVQKHITKPFSPSRVLDVLNEAAFKKIKNRAHKVDLSADGFSGNTILIAEDIDINREIVAAFLEHTKVNIYFAENGAQAVEMFRSEPDKYDLILMDIQMPEMDGFEATRQIRRMDIKRAKTIPIIAMTANAFNEDVKKCKEAGMNDHLAKPIEPDTLLVKLNDYFFMKDWLNHDIF